MELNKQMQLDLDTSKLLKYTPETLNKYVYSSNRHIGYPDRAIGEIDYINLKIVFYKKSRQTSYLYDMFDFGIDNYKIIYKLFNHNLILSFKNKRF